MPAFPTTQWSFITNLQEATGASRERLVESFLLRYLPPMRSYLRYRFPRLRADDHEDLLHDFVTDRVIQRALIDQARREKGKLRSYLQTCLLNFAKSWVARQSKSSTASLEAADFDEPALGTAADQPCPFDRAWAHHVLTEAVIRLKDECHQTGKQLMWDVFDLRMLRPLLMGADEVSYEALSSRWGVDAKQLANLLTTAKRKLRRNLEDLVGDYTLTPREIAEEIGQLFVFLAKPR